MGRRTVADEIRRVVVRLGGLPATHPVALPAPATHAPADPEVGSRALRPQVLAAVLRMEPPGAGAAAVRVPAPSTGARGGAAAITARARVAVGAALLARTGAVRTLTPPGTGSLASRPGPARAAAVAVVRAAGRDGHVVIEPGVRVRGRTPLPRRARARRPRRTPPPLLAPRRRRAAWDAMSRARLAGGWGRILADHRLPADDLELVGVYGPMALGLVSGVRLEADGRLRTELTPRAVAEPVGDMAIARHRPSGRLLRSAHPWDAGVRRGLH